MHAKETDGGDPPSGLDYLAGRLHEIEAELRHRQRARERAATLPPEALANQLAFWARILRMVAAERGACRCGWCNACLCAEALAGPAPGERWDEWEALKALNVERMRQAMVRPPPMVRLQIPA